MSSGVVHTAHLQSRGKFQGITSLISGQEEGAFKGMLRSGDYVKRSKKNGVVFFFFLMIDALLFKSKFNPVSRE